MVWNYTMEFHFVRMNWKWITFAMKEWKSSDKELRLIFLDLSDPNLAMFVAHVSQIFLSTVARTPALGTLEESVNQKCISNISLHL